MPDLAGWCRERIPELPQEAYFTVVPDWVCDVHSPSTRKQDLDSKKVIYARSGVSYLWLVDPDVRSLEAFVLCDREWVLIDRLFDYESVSLPPFDAISFDLGELWASKVFHRSVPDAGTADIAAVELGAELAQTAK